MRVKQTTLPPKGFRDFLPAEQYKREYVLSRLREAFSLSGFSPLVTPTVEYAATIMGKYGEEADRLVYKFNSRGDRELALRYDQTVPTARVLTEYQSQLPKYFRRYQIQNVFRGEKPQKGRYREFTQCDIDIFGSSEPVTDAEVLACAYNGFKNVGFSQVLIKVNDRKVLFDALQPLATESVSVFSIIQSIDKLDKKTESEVQSELESKGLTSDSAQLCLQSIKSAQPTPQLTTTIDLAVNLGVAPDSLQFTPTLARGLDYYTSTIWEFIVPEYGSGSVGGGGRYDRLIGQIGGPEIPATGMAFGFDRVVEAADQLGLIPSSSLGALVMVGVFSDSLRGQALELTSKLRATKIPTELYVGMPGKLDKQFKYANALGVRYVALIGDDETNSNKVQLKDMESGESFSLDFAEVVSKISPLSFMSQPYATS